MLVPTPEPRDENKEGMLSGLSVRRKIGSSHLPQISEIENVSYLSVHDRCTVQMSQHASPVPMVWTGLIKTVASLHIQW